MIYVSDISIRCFYVVPYLKNSLLVGKVPPGNQPAGKPVGEVVVRKIVPEDCRACSRGCPCYVAQLVVVGNV